MKLEPIEVPIAGTISTTIYGVRVQDAPDEIFQEMLKYAESLGAGSFSNTIWFGTESSRTVFLLRWS